MAKELLQDTLGETPAGMPEPVTYRPFGDSATMRKHVFDNVQKAVASKYPIENTRYRLSVDKLRYLDDKPFSLQDQKDAIMRGHTLHHRLGGDWVLHDKTTNQEIDRKSGVLAHVPYVTDRGTFIYKGNEYTVANQMRLKPGVYTRVKENGIIEAHVNTKPGTGPSFRVYMEPDTGIFRLGVGQSTLKMYPILRAMGVQDRDIEKQWGRDLLQKNIEAEDPRAVSRAFAKLVSTRADQAVAETNTAETGGMWKESEFELLEKVAHEFEDLPIAERIHRDAFIYLEPDAGDQTDFAECQTCRQWTGPDHKRCLILGSEVDVPATASCNLYTEGTPQPALAGKEKALLGRDEAGFVKRPVRCENCAFFDKEGMYCELYKKLNETSPEVFDLEEAVSPKGCCNANTAIDEERS